MELIDILSIYPHLRKNHLKLINFLLKSDKFTDKNGVIQRIRHFPHFLLEFSGKIDKIDNHTEIHIDLAVLAPKMYDRMAKEVEFGRAQLHQTKYFRKSQKT